ncbi:hypothetical protein LINGRAHAP2_LOCUS30685 [Linum grandiflorum]
MAAKFVLSSQLQQLLPTMVSAAGYKNLAGNRSTIFSFCNTRMLERFSTRRIVFTSLSKGRLFSNGVKPISATDSGVETSITDGKDSAITVKDAKVVVESQDENSIQLRVDLAGDVTEKVFGKVLRNLALTAPPIPGFRRQKGGKTTRENLKVKENKVTTTQTAEELKKLFEPGKEFGFNATLELEPVLATQPEA